MAASRRDGAQRQPQYHLITFATEEYADKARDLLESGRLVGGFDHVRLLGPSDIDDDFKARNAWAFGMKPGAGAGAGGGSGTGSYAYYIWKPYVVFRYMMECVAPGDVLCYCDSLYMFINDARPLIDGWTRQSPHVALTENTPYHCKFTEEDWTKRDAMLLMGVESECHECVERFDRAPQLSAGFVCVRKGFKGMSFVSEWLTYCQDRRIVSDNDDFVSRRCRPPAYRHNRHDQTVLSLLGKKWGIPFRPFGPGVLHNLRRNSGDPVIDARVQEVLRLIGARDPRVRMTEERPSLPLNPLPSLSLSPLQATPLVKKSGRKLAVIMTLYDEMPHADAWRAFFAGAEPDRVSLYVHQVTRAPLPHGFGLRTVPTHPSSYGGMDHWRLYNHLLAHALADDADNRMFVFVSQSCVPLRSFDEVFASAFASEKQSEKQGDQQSGRSMFTQYPEFDRTRVRHLTGVIAEENISKAEAWCALTRAHAQRMVDDEALIVKLFDPADQGNRVWYPDEHIYLTYLRHVGLGDQVGDQSDRGPTYTHWTPDHALLTYMVIHETSLREMVRAGYWFARKFAPGCRVRLRSPFSAHGVCGSEDNMSLSDFCAMNMAMPNPLDRIGFRV